MATPESPALPKTSVSPASPIFPHIPYTPEQNEALLELLSDLENGKLELSPLYKKSFEAEPEIFAVKFLTARKWNLDDARKMIQGTTEFRNEKKLDTSPLFPSTLNIRGYDVEELIECQGCGRREEGELDQVHNHLKNCYSSAWHKWDKGGRPVYIERSGHVRVKELVAKCKALTPPGGDIATPCLQSHLHSNEVGGILVAHRNAIAKKEGKPSIVQVTVIMDCDGMGLGHLFGPAMDILKAQSTMDQAYYPEGMYRLFVANAPSMINVAWSIVKGWIDPRVQKKVTFLKPADTAKGLLEHIDAENLPEYLGGTCNCEGGCVPDVKDADDTVDDGAGSLPLTEEFTVSRGATVLKEYEVLKGNKVTWSYACNNAKHDVTFKLVSKKGEDEAGDVVTELVKKNQGNGEFEATEACKLVFSFDNSYAWVNSKTLCFRIQFA